MVATLNQPQYKPWPHAEQVVALYAGINGYLDEIPVAQVPRFQDELREALRSERTVYAAIEESKDLSDETTAKLDEELKRFVHNFNVEEETGLVA
jgi:F-type H+-transporting ATPase subunit alpha